MLSSSITNSAPFENSPSTIPSNDFKKVDYYPKAVSMESIRKKLSRDDDAEVDGLATHFDDMDKTEHYILPKNDLEGDLEEDLDDKDDQIASVDPSSDIQTPLISERSEIRESQF